MIGYANGLNRIFNKRGFNIDILRDKIFIDKKNGFRQVLEIHIAKQQSNDMPTKHHNTSDLSDIRKVLSHNWCSLLDATGYLNRLFFVISLLIGLFPTALANMTLDQLDLQEKDGKPVFILTENYWERNGSSSNKQGGLKFIKRDPVTIPLQCFAN